MIDLRLGDCIEVLKTLPDNSVDSIVTDPPYGLEFMGKEWDTFKTGRIAKYKEGGDLDLEQIKSRKGKGGAGPSYTKRAASKCKKCAKQRWSGSPCKCDEPDFEIDNSTQHTFQDFTESWARECYRVLKPGGYLLSFGGSRMYHRMACGIEDAGFEVRDQIMWIYGQGFPKSHNIGKAIDKIQGNEREVVGVKEQTGAKFKNWSDDPNETRWHNQGFNKLDGREFDLTKGNSDWEGWGTALKPAVEPICMARKPLSEKSIAENVLKHGTGGINIDGCRIGSETISSGKSKVVGGGQLNGKNTRVDIEETFSEGRFPANIIFDEEAGKLLDEQSGPTSQGHWSKTKTTGFGEFGNGSSTYEGVGPKDKNKDKQGASRFFYCPKVSKKERNAGLDDMEDKILNRVNSGGLEHDKKWAPVITKNNHPTVKPIKLMEYLIKLVTPKGGIVLEPFMGSGSTGIAAKNLGMSFIGIEREQEYFDIAKQRIGE
jgi:site-specific DNA-methyltransferase (adenine-specific)